MCPEAATQTGPVEDGSTPPPRSNGAQRRLGDVVVELGFADREQIEAAVTGAAGNGRPIGQVLLDARVLDSRQLAQALAERNGLGYVDLNSFEVDKGAANLISPAEARRFRAIPISFIDERTLLVACAEPQNVLGFDDIRLATG